VHVIFLFPLILILQIFVGAKFDIKLANLFLTTSTVSDSVPGPHLSYVETIYVYPFLPLFMVKMDRHRWLRHVRMRSLYWAYIYVAIVSSIAICNIRSISQSPYFYYAGNLGVHLQTGMRGGTPAQFPSGDASGSFVKYIFFQEVLVRFRSCMLPVHIYLYRLTFITFLKFVASS